ncbi:MAG: hypothetical protein KDE20_16420 [Caldilineaceae bacterium]|nr:hypothetical protein [Caldilineaceae bacterium]
MRAESGGAHLPPVHSVPPIGPATDVVRVEAVHAPNGVYVLTSRHPDPYAMWRLGRSGQVVAAREEQFDLPMLVSDVLQAQQGDTLELELWTDLSIPHSARFWVNGTDVGSLRWNEEGVRTFTANLPPGVLRRGSNTLRLELLPDTGERYDGVALESIKTRYARALTMDSGSLTFETAAGSGSGTNTMRAIEDRIRAENFEVEGVAACSGQGCDVYRVSGLQSPDVVILRERNGQVERMANPRVVAEGAAYSAEFASSSRAGDRFRVESPNGVPAEVRASLTPTDPLAGGRTDYLIIAHPSFIDGLAPFVAARRSDGLSVKVVDVEDLYRWYSDGVLDPKAIDEAISDAFVRLNTRYVLLVGNDTRDPLNFTTTGSISFIPTNYAVVGDVIRFAPTDVPYADIDGDLAVDVALGRWPVRTQAELQTIIEKTLAYPQADHGSKMLLLSDRKQSTVEFGPKLEILAQTFGTGWLTTRVRLDSYPVTGTSIARSDFVSAVNQGQALTTFMGHGAPLAWTRESLVTSDLLNGGLLSNAGRPTAAWVVGCYGSYFVQPDYNSVGHALLVRNSSGAAAIFGASTLTDIADDEVWIYELAPELRLHRIGDALMLAQNRLRVQGDHRKDIWLGVSLLGDPALRIKQ